MINIPESTLKEHFVTALMRYFKIEEDIFLRGHIADLLSAIDSSRYQEFMMRLTQNEHPFKNPFEKIVLTAQSFKAPAEANSAKRSKYLYDVMYELRKSIILADDPTPAQERFEQVHISRIRDKNSGELLLQSDDIEVIKNLGKRWIFDHVAGDKTHFLRTVQAQYDKLLDAPSLRLSHHP